MTYSRLADEAAYFVTHADGAASNDESIKTLREQLAAAMAEIERLQEQLAEVRFRNERLVADYAEVEQQLANSQEECNALRRIHAENIAIFDYKLAQALSAPSDTSALEAMIAKAGEKMRERCIEIADCSAIRALPGVTLEDLK